MQRSSRVDYDAIAELYDSTPHREKSADPELIAFLGGRGPSASLTLLDIACGTGNQQIANRGREPDARFVGLDGSLGMLRQARRKMPDIAWVHGDSAAKPIRLKLRRVTGFRRAEITALAKRNFNSASTVVSDGLRCFAGVSNAGCQTGS